MTVTERQELLELLFHLRAHAISSEQLGEAAEATAFREKYAALLTEHDVTEAEVDAAQGQAPPQDVVTVKLHCYRVIYGVVTVFDNGEAGSARAVQRSVKDSSRFVVAPDETGAAAAVIASHAGKEVHVQQVAALAKDVLVAA